MAQRAPETLTLVRHRTQPTAETIVRLTGTAVFAYLISLTVPGTSHSVLAPLTALLVAQVSLYQTLRSAISRVAAVVAGVLLAVGLAALAGFTWWSLGITIAVALAIGYALHLGDNTLEVPISARVGFHQPTPFPDAPSCRFLACAGRCGSTSHVRLELGRGGPCRRCACPDRQGWRPCPAGTAGWPGWDGAAGPVLAKADGMGPQHSRMR